MSGDGTTRFFLTNLVFCRSQLGPDLQTVVLDMALDDQIERVKKRHKGEESAIEMCKVDIANFFNNKSDICIRPSMK